ncbi:hypothetical protein JMN32_21830 [Fulvivirga sp. 29W222]|uniref:HTH domain-containing protein n=1 Tax=Fulvivirga marina TaxID=2494733 RepID=A0A937KDB4_9BACT|nr:hypothetical protein [Fulvivirga marina]MBL6448966.1 hypothetical protein [Fulvivirga marina]
MKSSKVIERIVQTDRLLQSGNIGNADDFAKQLDVSKRTVFNLLKMLKDDFGAPVIFDKRSKSYRYARKGSIVMDFVTEDNI